MRQQSLAGLKTEGAERLLTASTCRSSKLNLILAEVGTRPRVCKNVNENRLLGYSI